MDQLDATIHLAFAFDIGYEIDLDRARAMLPGESGALARRRRTPESIQYRPAPLRLTLDASGMALPGGMTTTKPPRAELTVFDFAAISLMVQFPVRATPMELLELAGSLADPGPLNMAARLVVNPWIERLKPVVDGFEVSDFSEEYVVFQVGDVHPEWIAANTDWIARLIRLEAGPLSLAEVREATRLGFSYTPDDLVMLDWAAGFVADVDCADTLQVIEFANVQLLEFRHIDDRLDDRLESAYRLIHAERGRDRRPTFWRTHSATVRSVRELEIEATSLFERADNNLKLIGDQYLSRVFDLGPDPVPPDRVAAEHPPQARGCRRCLRPARPAGRRDADGSPRDYRRRPHRPRNPSGVDPPLKAITLFSHGLRRSIPGS